MMRAAQLTQPGGPENLYVGEVPRPVPQEGEVLIKVKATAINRADTLQVFQGCIQENESLSVTCVCVCVYAVSYTHLTLPTSP